MDDFRTLIASGFEFPVLSWCPPSQEKPSESSAAVDTPKQRAAGKNLENHSQSHRSGTKLAATPNDYGPDEQTDSSNPSRTGNDLNGHCKSVILVHNTSPSRVISTQFAGLTARDVPVASKCPYHRLDREMAPAIRKTITPAQDAAPNRKSQAPLRSLLLCPETYWPDTTARNFTKRYGRCLCGRSQKSTGWPIRRWGAHSRGFIFQPLLTVTAEERRPTLGTL